MSQNPQDDFIVEDMNALRAAIEAFKGWGDYIGTNQRHYFMAKAIRAYLDALPAASQEAAAPSEEPVAWRDLYDANVPMADGEIRMTAAEDVLAWLLIEKIGVPDDMTITPKQAQDTIVNVIDRLREYEDAALASPAVAPVAVSVDGPDEIEIDRLRLAAFKTNSNEDKAAYYLAVSKWFQDRHYRSSIILATKGGEDALADLDSFIERVGSGHFYEDYDASISLLGKARKALSALSAQDTDGVAKP